MASRDRPLSPHLQIYKPQITSGLSILHRLTGILLAIGALFLFWWLIAAACGADAFATAQGFFGSFVGVILLLGLVPVVFYKMFSGLRHLAWDLGYGFDLHCVTQSGRATLAATAVATLIVWIAGLVAW